MTILSSVRKTLFGNASWSTVVLWVVYLSLLAVTTPHVMWAFSQFEQDGFAWIGLVAAISFEGAIAAFTWRLKQIIEATPKFRSGHIWLKKIQFRYANVYTLGLFVAIVISAAANWSHSVEFGESFVIFEEYSIPPLLYSIAFGGILPLCSLLFARVLADVNDAEAEVNEEILSLQQQLKDSKRIAKEAETRVNAAEERADDAERAAKLIVDLVKGDRVQRIEAINVLAAQLPYAVPQNALAKMAQVSDSYYSQIVKGNGNAE